MVGLSPLRLDISLASACVRGTSLSASAAYTPIKALSPILEASNLENPSFDTDHTVTPQPRLLKKIVLLMHKSKIRG